MTHNQKSGATSMRPKGFTLIELLGHVKWLKDTQPGMWTTLSGD